jgi:cobalamin synthase
MAIRTLTIIPIPGKDPERKFLALPWFPLIGAGIGLLHVSGNYLFTLLPAKTPTLEAVFLCALNYIITGALHLDGLADTADAFGTLRTREKTLLILKDPHMGTFGVAALVFAILWRTLVYQLLIDQNGLFWIVYAMVFSRIGMIRRVAAAGVEAITVLCTNMQGARLASMLEGELGIPIFDSISTAMWGALRGAGQDPSRIRGWGRLFSLDPVARLSNAV